MQYHRFVDRDAFLRACRRRGEAGDVTVLRMPKHIRLQSGELRQGLRIRYWCDESDIETLMYSEFAVADPNGNVDLSKTLPLAHEGEIGQHSLAGGTDGNRGQLAVQVGLTELDVLDLLPLESREQRGQRPLVADLEHDEVVGHVVAGQGVREQRVTRLRGPKAHRQVGARHRVQLGGRGGNRTRRRRRVITPAGPP